MYLFIARQFFYSVPDELIEAARIDGVSHAGAFFKIVCPMSKPLYATIAILAFTGRWNSYLVPATFINRIEKYTLVVGLQTVNMSFFQKTNLTMAGVVLLSFRVILLFIVSQKKCVLGVMASGINAEIFYMPYEVGIMERETDYEGLRTIKNDGIPKRPDRPCY